MELVVTLIQDTAIQLDSADYAYRNENNTFNSILGILMFVVFLKGLFINWIISRRDLKPSLFVPPPAYVPVPETMTFKPGPADITGALLPAVPVLLLIILSFFAEEPGAYLIIAFLFGMSDLFLIGRIILHLGDRVVLDGNSISIKDMTRKIEIELEQVDRIVLKYRDDKSLIAHLIYTELLFQGPDLEEKVILSDTFFRRKSRSILSSLAANHPDKQFAIHWYRNRRDTEPEAVMDLPTKASH